jgi:hypothetical protein
VKLSGVKLHVPEVALKVSPTEVVPLISGKIVLVGACECAPPIGNKVSNKATIGITDSRLRMA